MPWLLLVKRRMPDSLLPSMVPLLPGLLLGLRPMWPGPPASARSNSSFSKAATSAGL